MHLFLLFLVFISFWAAFDLRLVAFQLVSIIWALLQNVIYGYGSWFVCERSGRVGLSSFLATCTDAVLSFFFAVRDFFLCSYCAWQALLAMHVSHFPRIIHFKCFERTHSNRKMPTLIRFLWKIPIIFVPINCDFAITHLGIDLIGKSSAHTNPLTHFRRVLVKSIFTFRFVRFSKLRLNVSTRRRRNEFGVSSLWHRFDTSESEGESKRDSFVVSNFMWKYATFDEPRLWLYAVDNICLRHTKLNCLLTE